MEEILASIRRIIEDSDTARRQVDDSEETAASFEAERELQSAVAVETFREELKPTPPAMPVSLAQIQAEAEREPRREYPAAEAWPEPVAPRQSGDAHHEPGSFERELIEREEERARNRNSGEAELAAAEEAPEPVHAENQNPRPAILSDRAGRQVAASFGELSEAFAASRRKSFEKTAEDMMRPMLQDWLDNNLPLLVERLVREEIERVARGGAR